MTAYAVVYGPATDLLDPVQPRLAIVPVMDPLPSPDAPTPRRRRTVICGHLRVNGQRIEADTAEDAANAWKWLERLLRPTKRTLVECTVRGARLEPEYVADMCASSWCRQCAWRES